MLPLLRSQSLQKSADVALINLDLNRYKTRRPHCGTTAADVANPKLSAVVGIGIELSRATERALMMQREYLVEVGGAKGDGFHSKVLSWLKKISTRTVCTEEDGLFLTIQYDFLAGFRLVFADVVVGFCLRFTGATLGTRCLNRIETIGISATGVHSLHIPSSSFFMASALT